MTPRQTILDLITEIMKRPLEIKKLNSKELKFFNDMKEASLHYGYTFSENQLKYLSSIYRKIYDNI